MTSVLLKLSLLLSFCMPTNSAVSFEKNVANMAVAESTILTCSPTAICVNGVTISLPDGSNPSVTINAADLDFASYSDCPGAGALSFSFDANSPLTQQTFNCTQLGFPTLNLWVTDIAGNQSSCETFIIVQDNQASCSGGGGGNLPTPICVNGMVVSLPDTNNPLVTIDADDLNIGSYSDNPSAGALSFSFDAAGSVTQQSFDCAQLGQNTIELYVRDQLGNTNFCSTYISVQDNQASCPGGGAGNLPTPICVNGIVATLPNTNNPMVTINATDLDFGSYNDNPSAGMLSFSFDANVSITEQSFDCTQIGVNEIQLYVKNQLGNTSSCVTFIIIQDGLGTCQSCAVTDRATLMALYNATDGANWTNNTNWGSAQPLDTWFGVTTDGNGCVDSLILPYNNLIGTVPVTIEDLSELQCLNLVGNTLGSNENLTVTGASLTPAPMFFPGGSGVINFNFDATNGLTLLSAEKIQITVEASNIAWSGVPTGSGADLFTWAIDSANPNLYIGTRMTNLPSLSGGFVFIPFIVTASSTISSPANGAVVTLLSHHKDPLPQPIPNGDNSTAVHTYTIEGTNINIQGRVFLGGAFNQATGMMTDNLRALNLIPTTEPYNTGNGETCAPSVFNITGNDAIVDWVVVELRDKNDNTNVLATRAALLQRDGDIVDVDGTSPLSFETMTSDDYYVCVGHRNHLGIMSAGTVALSTTPVNLDFSDSNVAAFTFGGQPARATVGGVEVLFSGDASGDGFINAVDSNLYWSNQNGQSSYNNAADFDLNGFVNASDKNLQWFINNGKLQQVP